VKVRVDGAEEIARALESIKVGIANRLLRQAANKLASRGNKTARAKLTRKRTRALRRSLGTKGRSYKGVYFVAVGPRRGFKTEDEFGRPVDPVHYAHLVERGRKEVRPKKGKYLVIPVVQGGRAAVKTKSLLFVRSARAVAASPFLGPAYDDARSRALDVAGPVIRDGIIREAAKAKAKGKTIYRV
jgi:hypothetical protein